MVLIKTSTNLPSAWHASEHPDELMGRQAKKHRSLGRSQVLMYWQEKGWNSDNVESLNRLKGILHLNYLTWQTYHVEAAMNVHMQWLMFRFDIVHIQLCFVRVRP